MPGQGFVVVVVFNLLYSRWWRGACIGAKDGEERLWGLGPCSSLGWVGFWSIGSRALGHQGSAMILFSMRILEPNMRMNLSGSSSPGVHAYDSVCTLSHPSKTALQLPFQPPPATAR
jgi:hypothetical protein